MTGTGGAAGPGAGARAESAAWAPAGASVVIGVGNPFRRDDGIGPAVAAEIGRQQLPGVRVVVSDGEPSGLIEAWSGAALAVIVDALHSHPAGGHPAGGHPAGGHPAGGRPGVPAPAPGRVHRVTPAGLETSGRAGSSHGLGVPDAFRLGRALGRLPARAVIVAVEAADTRPGPGLSAAVAAAVPDAVAAVAAELRGAGRGGGPTNCAGGPASGGY